jgi:alkanesulfonate monooxygenase SsuD/methylene tetrahydromethanopterin reductase-like flavin-dependent oxidoreductase (luciferase family)
MRTFRATLDGHLAEGGRRPEEVIILWPVFVFVADTMDAAVAQKDDIVSSLPMEAGGIYMSHKSGFDFSTLPPRFTIAEAVERIEAKQGSTAYLSSFIALGPETKLSLEDFCELGRQAMLGGRPTLVGTPGDIADQLEQLHEDAGPGIGFMIEVKHRMPGLPIDFCEKVVPILQKRGVYRTDYAGSLRENLELAERSDKVTW